MYGKDNTQVSIMSNWCHFLKCDSPVSYYIWGHTFCKPIYSCFVLEIGSCYVAHAGPELEILLPLLSSMLVLQALTPVIL
jgi:hypothetical protein